MLRPYKGKDIAPYNPTVLDIETAPDGRIIAIGFAYDIGAIHYEVFDTVEQWYQHYSALVCQYRSSRLISKQLARIYAHNGANFDWLSIYEALYQRGLLIDGKYIMADSIGIGAQFKIAGIDDSITLLDSYRMMPASLEKLTKTFKVNNVKQSVPEDCKDDYEQFKIRYPELFYSYLKNDVLGLQQVIRKFWDMIYQKFGSVGYLPMTLPSLSLRVFTKFIDEPLLVPQDKELKQLERDAYKGGLTLCMRTGVYPKINVFDVNSMYPFHMATQLYPSSYQGYWTKTFKPKSIGLWKVEYYEQTRRDIPPFLFDKVEGAAYSGSGVYTTQELNHLVSLGGRFTLTKGYVYTQSKNLFKEYITLLYNERKSAKAKGDEALEFTLKIMMNSLYGKFGQREEGYSVEIATPDKMRELAAKKIPFGVLGNFIAIPEHRDVPHVFVGLAAHVTAYARIDLHSRMVAMIQQGYNVVYCDTDSIHTNGTIPEDLELGGIKLEFSGEGAYAGRKLYALRNGDKVKISAKGIGRKTLGTSVTFDTLAKLATSKDASQEFRFTVFPTVKEVLAERQKSAVMLTRKRKIRNTGGIWDNNGE